MKKSIAFLILTFAGLAGSFAQQAHQVAPFNCGGGTCSGTTASIKSPDPDRNGNNTLGQVFKQNAFGLNYVTNSRVITTRYNSGTRSALPSVFSVINVSPCSYS